MNENQNQDSLEPTDERPAIGEQTSGSSGSLWGILAEFDGVESLSAAIGYLHDDGLKSIEAYSPFPSKELATKLKLKRSPMPLIIMCGGLLGGASVYALAYWISVYAYVINVGGRPLNSWPAFIPPTFEGTVLISSFFALIGLILVCGLPRLHHPLFEIEAFKERASSDGFFLAVKSEDERFDSPRLSQRLADLGASGVWEVPLV